MEKKSTPIVHKDLFPKILQIKNPFFDFFFNLLPSFWVFPYSFPPVWEWYYAAFEATAGPAA